MSSRRRRGNSDHAEEEHVDERWLVSYADMITVLMCLFLVLFAMSSVDQHKFEQLKNSLATGFGATDIGAIDTAEGVVIPEDKVNEEAEGFSEMELAIQEIDSLKALRDQITANLQAQGLAHAVEFTLDERGLTIRLIGSETYFTPNSIELVGVAPKVLDSIAPALLAVEHDVSVEGHADARQAVAPYPTNWELSSGRATQVLRRLVESGGIAADRIAAVGFGSSRPIAAGKAPGDLAKNRRVDIVALSDQPESVRGLIPDLLENNVLP